MSELYSSSKIFHFQQKLDDLKNGRITPPVHVRLKPTNRCNHRCSYCCYRSEDLLLNELMDQHDEIPAEKMREVVGDLTRMGVKAVTFTGGGEPLCYPHLQQTAEGLLDGGVKVAMLTNGGLLTGDIAELLARRATWVRVSMDAADAALYARTRQVRMEEFGIVCDNISRFCRMPDRHCVMGINFIATRENHASIFAFLQMAKSLGIDHVKVSGAVVSVTPRENLAYLQPFIDTAKQQVERAGAELSDEKFSVIDKLHLPDSDAESFTRDYHRCPFAQCLTVIAADMNVYTCQDKAYTQAGCLGSIKDQSFADLWAGEDLQERLSRLDPSKECRHHCVAHGKNLSLLDYLAADEEHLDFV